MTALIVFLVLAVFAAVATVRALQHDRPRTPPVSHSGWGDPRLPSRPYSAGV